MQRTRDQERARHAYRCVGEVKEKELGADYKPRVNGFPAMVQRNGLAAAISFVERDASKEDKAAALFLTHLADADIPNLKGKKGNALPGAIRALPVPDYMLATREVLKISIWFRRAAQALLGEEK